MQINPQSKSITYSIEKIGDVERVLNEIEKDVLENDEVTGNIACNICSQLSFIRDALSLKQSVRRHKKFAPQLQDKEI